MALPGLCAGCRPVPRAPGGGLVLKLDWRAIVDAVISGTVLLGIVLLLIYVILSWGS